MKHFSLYKLLLTSLFVSTISLSVQASNGNKIKQLDESANEQVSMLSTTSNQTEQQEHDNSYNKIDTLPKDEQDNADKQSDRQEDDLALDMYAIEVEDLDEMEKGFCLATGNAVFFDTYATSPSLKIYSPLLSEVTDVNFAATKTLKMLKKTKKTVFNVAKKTIAEELYDASHIKGFDRLARSVRKPGSDELVEAYRCGTPLCLKLKNAEELKQFCGYLQESLERQGIMPRPDKPLLALYVDHCPLIENIDKKTVSFITDYFTPASLADSDVRSYFLKAQRSMIEDVDTVYASGAKFPNDTMLSAVTRSLNKEYKQLSAKAYATEIASKVMKWGTVATIGSIALWAGKSILNNTVGNVLAIKTSVTVPGRVETLGMAARQVKDQKFKLGQWATHKLQKARDAHPLLFPIFAPIARPGKIAQSIYLQRLR